jgi:hypothetical protein
MLQIGLFALTKLVWGGGNWLRRHTVKYVGKSKVRPHKKILEG